MLKYKCIIFDCDGVLVDSETISAKIFQEMLFDQMRNVFGLEFLVKYTFGLDQHNRPDRTKAVASCLYDLNLIRKRLSVDDTTTCHPKTNITSDTSDHAPCVCVCVVVVGIGCVRWWRGWGVGWACHQISAMHCSKHRRNMKLSHERRQSCLQSFQASQFLLDLLELLLQL